MGITKSDSQYKGPETKDQYITPECEVLEIIIEGVIAISCPWGLID